MNKNDSFTRTLLIYWMVSMAFILPVMAPIFTKLDPQWWITGALYLIAAALWALVWKSST